jgi:hypothetical protein
MSDAVVFVVVFVGLFVLRIIVATILFLWILPDGDRCPNCDAVTLRMQSRGVNRLVPWFRPSWCMGCGWDGMLRKGPLTPPVPTVPQPRIGAPQRGSARP